MEREIVVDWVLENLDLTRSDLEAGRLTLLDEVLEEELLSLAELFHI